MPAPRSSSVPGSGTGVSPPGRTVMLSIAMPPGPPVTLRPENTADTDVIEPDTEGLEARHAVASEAEERRAATGRT